MRAADPRLRQFADFLTRSGRRTTRQRAVIVRAFFDAEQHLSAEELYRQISVRVPGIGLVTVYRTLKLLRDAGLATERQFGESYARFDPIPADRPHNHLICTRCGKIEEFQDAAVRHLWQKVARGHGFAVTECKLELYGLCRKCARQGAGRSLRGATGLVQRSGSGQRRSPGAETTQAAGEGLVRRRVSEEGWH